MITDKKNGLKGILESTSGIHLTGYLVNRGDLSDLKQQLTDVIDEANEFLIPVMGDEERRRFLEPLDALLEDAGIFRKMKGNVGLFRTERSFRVLSIPIELEPACVVATTFHVKPILKWMQVDQEFLLLGLERNVAHLYHGSQHSLRKVDSFVHRGVARAASSEARQKPPRSHPSEALDAFAPLHDWLDAVTKTSKPKLFLAGAEPLTQAFMRGTRYRNHHIEALRADFEERMANELADAVRDVLRLEVNETLEKAILEFRMAEDLNLAKRNIFQIARAAVQGRIRKLIVADGIKIFGKIDPKTGGVEIHPFDLDHEDDDLLDDLAQKVLSQGGEVIVAAREQIPKGRPIIAILYRDDASQERVGSGDDDMEALQERRTV